ncbi:MAG: hypothetical protein M3N39_04075, partial [Pseudomonadota bacterium]|nr:hypothetical protein [Pseudomonadota bacterium]
MIALRFTTVTVCAALAVAGCDSAVPEPRPHEKRGGPHSQAPIPVGSDIAEFYKIRGFRPLWVTRSGVKPEARQLAVMIEDAANDGLDPNRYSVADVKAALQAAASGDAEGRARAELLLSRAYVRYARDLREPRHPGAMTYVDAELAPVRASSADLLEELSKASDLRGHLAALQEVNPLYSRLRRGAAAYRKRWSALPRISLPPGPDLRPGDTGERVDLLRRRLGLREGRAFDGALAKAVRTFKAVHALPPDPVADAAT